MNDNIETRSPWDDVWAPEFCLACHERDERLTQQPEDKTMPQQKEEPTQDEMTTQRQGVTGIEAVDREHDRGGDNMIYVKHQGRLR